ncbi:HEAT repeat domain-containing protein [Thermogutta sp.]|uniref:HEAT repeat domain-containing protein n=1 Tax=Thermogutta sp. TaxID=1962930 RepID=UPI003C7AB6D1
MLESQVTDHALRWKGFPAILTWFRKLCFLAGLTGLFILGAPHLVDLVVRLHVQQVGRELPSMPESQAFHAIAELEELGPAGAEAVARGLLHPQSNVAEFVAKVLWEKVFAARTSTQAIAEANAAVAGIVKVWPKIAVDRRHQVSKILQLYLEGFSGHASSSAQLAAQCAAILRELPADPQLAEKTEAGTPAPSAQRSQLKTAEGQRSFANPLRAPQSNQPALTAAAQHAQERVQLAHYAAETEVGPNSLTPRVSPAVGGMPSQNDHASALPQVTPLSFGPGQMPPTLRIPEHAEPLSGPEELPRQQAIQDMEESPPSGNTVSPLTLEFPGALSLQKTRDGSTKGTLEVASLQANPWQRDRALWSQLAAGGPESAKAQEKLRELGWMPDAFLVGRLAFHPNPEERCKAVAAIWNTASLDPLPLLMLLACDPDHTVRLEALSALGTMSTPEALSIIRTLAVEDPDHQVRVLANEILAKSR